MQETLTLIAYIVAAIIFTILIIIGFKNLTITLVDPESRKESRKRNSKANLNKKQGTEQIGFEMNKVYVNSYEFNRLSDDVKLLIRDVEQIRKSLIKIEDMYRSIKQVPSDYHIIGNSREITKGLDTQSLKERMFFMSGPAGNGFKDSLKSLKFEHGMTMYKFELKDTFSASFCFYGDEVSTKDALSLSGKYIEPVCDEVNKVSSSSKKIITNKDGFVLLEGDKWIVKQKAKIRYE
jgi:hypothetical protein